MITTRKTIQEIDSAIIAKLVAIKNHRLLNDCWSSFTVVDKDHNVVMISADSRFTFSTILGNREPHGNITEGGFSVMYQVPDWKNEKLFYIARRRDAQLAEKK